MDVFFQASAASREDIEANLRAAMEIGKNRAYRQNDIETNTRSDSSKFDYKFLSFLPL